MIRNTRNIVIRISLFCLLMAGLFSYGYGQESELQNRFPSECSSELPAEDIVISTDRNIYVGGENLFFQAYVLTEGKLSSPLSKVLYLQIEDEQNQVVAQVKVVIANGLADGFIEIPDRIPTAIYRLHAFTNYSRNLGDYGGAFEFVKILNPVLPAKKIAQIEEGDSLISNMDVHIKINTSEILDESPIEIGTRKQVSVNLSNIPESLIGHVRVVPQIAQKAYDRELTILSERFNMNLSESAAISKTKIQTLEFLPEHRGMYVSGIVRDAETEEAIQGVLCQLTVLGEVEQLHIDRTDEDGRFFMVVKELYDMHQMHVGLIEETDRKVEVLIDKDFNFDPISFEGLTMDISDIMIDNYQRLASYAQLNRYSTIELEDARSPGNIANFDVSINTADYVKVKSIEELIIDILPNVYVRLVEGKKGVVVFNEGRQITHKAPMVLLDRVPITNMEAFLKIPASSIDHVDINYNSNFIGDTEINAMVAFSTKEADFAAYPFESDDRFFKYEGFQPMSQWTLSPDLGNDRKTNPDFRTTLLWHSARFLGPESEITFLTSDAVESYEMIVSGINEQGQYVTYRQAIEVISDTVEN